MQGIVKDIQAAPQQADVHSTTAEVAAILHSLTWIINNNITIPTTIYSDATTALGLAQAQYVPHANVQLVELTATCFQYAKYHLPLVGLHVKAHSGAPWNELADDLSKQAGDFKTTFFPRSLQLLLYPSTSLAWRWLQHSKDTHAYPDVIDREIQFQPQVTFKAPEPEPPPPVVRQLRMVVKYATLNILTAIEEEDATQIPNPSTRMAAIRDYFEKTKSHFIGLQEPRLAEHSKRKGNFLSYASNAVDGNLGCSLLANTKVPYGTIEGRDLYFQKRHMTVSKKTPRILAVDIAAPYYTARHVVAHAPTAGATEAGKAFFYFEMQQITGVDKHVVVHIDANARSPIVKQPEIQAPADVKQNAKFFSTFLDEGEFWTPTLDDRFEESWKHTFSFNAGAEHTINYVLIPEQCRKGVRQAYRDHEYDNLLPRDDHFPSFVSIVIEKQYGRVPKKWRPPKLDPAKLADPAGRQAFSLALAQIPACKW